MESSFFPTTKEIQAFVEDELTDEGGRVSDAFADNRHLFLRTVLPGIRDVRPGDHLRAGIALMVIDDDVRVHPYLFRQVCSNGAILARTAQSRSLRRTPDDAPGAVQEVYAQISEALRASRAEEAFDDAYTGIRSAMDQKADLAIQLIPRLSRFGLSQITNLLGSILERFEKDHDNSVFGLMNAVTAVARTVREPVTRWRLEELGGELALLIAPRPPTPPAQSKPNESERRNQSSPSAPSLEPAPHVADTELTPVAPSAAT